MYIFLFLFVRFISSNLILISFCNHRKHWLLTMFHRKPHGLNEYVERQAVWNASPLIFSANCAFCLPFSGLWFWRKMFFLFILQLQKSNTPHGLLSHLREVIIDRNDELIIVNLSDDAITSFPNYQIEKQFFL